MSNWWREKPGVMMWLGILFLLLFGFGIMVGVLYHFGFPYYDASVLPALGFACVPTALIPGVVLLAMGMKARREETSVVEFAGWINTYKRVQMAEVARKLQKSEFETEKLLVHAIDKGLIRGLIDRQTNEFVLEQVIGQGRFVDACPNCGGKLQKQYLAGQTIVCPYCSSVIADSRAHG